MNVLQIEGGFRLRGEIEVSGSKNIALALLSAVALCKEPVTLRNVPRISDTHMKAHLLEEFGAKVDWDGNNLTVDCSGLKMGYPSEESVRAIRTSFYMLGPLLARLGEVELPAPGGCKIGARPVDYHVRGLQLMGAEIELTGGKYYAKAARIKGADIYLDFPSAGATQHLMSTAVLAEGVTTIQNAAMEPEVVALADFLRAMGAKIEGAGTATITVFGGTRLHSCSFRVPADRIQVGTFLLAGAITEGDVSVVGIMPEDQTAVVNKLREAGAQVEETSETVRVRVDRRLEAIRIRTMPHPGFPTDIQQPMAATLTLANGTSVIEETIYESRSGHVPELVRMGANIQSEGRTSIIHGVKRLHGANVVASDLRAGAALCLAGLAADGVTTVENVHYIDRGYEAIEHTLSALGGKVKRVAVEPRKVR